MPAARPVLILDPFFGYLCPKKPRLRRALHNADVAFPAGHEMKTGKNQKNRKLKDKTMIRLR